MASIGNITFACENPAAMAEFWTSVLDYRVQEAPPGFIEAWIAQGRDPKYAAAAVDPEGRGPRLFFMKMKKRPEVEGTSIPIHLDINTDDREAEVKRLEKLGASVVETITQRTGDYIETWTVMRDPEGNGFCVQ
jgi:predicted enzyme related to lactoylglutathione lyase